MRSIIVGGSGYGKTNLLFNLLLQDDWIDYDKTRFGGRGFGLPTFWQTCTSTVNQEDMDGLFPFIKKWEAHII